MSETYALYNPLAGNGQGEPNARKLGEEYQGRRLVYKDITALEDYAGFFGALNPEDTVIVCGGDGTLNLFANAVYGMEIPNEILYYPTGTGNDFARDIKGTENPEPFRVNELIRNLPTVTVAGKTTHFINGIGFGIDGYCCEVGDQLRQKGKKPNYALIAIQGLLWGYSAPGGEVTVDGAVTKYQKIWIAPTMFGRYYGGGMMPTPRQDRKNPARKVSFASFHDSAKLKTLIVFPSIFSGKHVKHTEMIDIFSGNHVKVRFDRPASLQIDGETVLNVTEYEVRSGEDTDISK